MKKLLFIFLLVISNLVLSKEINLLCKGQEKDFSTGRLDTGRTYEITFDDVKKTVPIMTTGLVLGCFPDQYYKSTKCVCSVTEREVKCDGSIVGTKGNYTGEQSFVLNRYTGKLMTNRTLSGTELDTGKEFFIGTSGDLSCEVLSKKKF